MNVVVSADEAARRTIRRSELVACETAFIDCRTPGSDSKENYALIGSGVSQSEGQFINLREDHGYNIGAAAMPNGVTNSLHLHFTAEVFMNFRGEWKFRWGPEGTDGEYVSSEGDVISMPTWIFRGFTNVGPDDGWLFTALGRSNTGGIIWGPSVIEEAQTHGLYLSTDNLLIDTQAGDALPSSEELIRPIPDEVVSSLVAYSPEEIRARVTTAADRVFSTEPFLCSGLPGGAAQLAPVIGFGMIEDRNAHPRVVNPHGFNLAWLRAQSGEGMLRHRHAETQVLIVRSGTWSVTLNEPGDEISVVLEPWDTLSIPPGAWRRFSATTDDEWAEMVVINGGDARVALQWAPEVWSGAAERDRSRDANGYLARRSLLAVMATDEMAE